MIHAGAHPFAFEGMGVPREASEIGEHDEAVLFGASQGAVDVESYLRDLGVGIAAYLDSDVRKQGTRRNGVPVLAPERVGDVLKPGMALVIASVYQREIAERLAALGVPASRVFPRLTAARAGHFGRAALAPRGVEIARILGLLADEESRAVYLGQVRFRWTMDPRTLRRNPLLEGPYLYRGLGPRPGDLIVDCGACRGETVLDMDSRLGGHGRFLAVEPDPSNHAALLERCAPIIRQGRCKAVRCALGDRVGEIGFVTDDNPTLSRIAPLDQAAERVPLRTLDSLADETESGAAGFVKMDVEGCELEVLRGGAALLARDSPDLAVAGYHRSGDLWEIPLHLLALDPPYRVYAAHHHAALDEIEFFATRREEPRSGATKGPP
jgi:FkbM family methyltransferase